MKRRENYDLEQLNKALDAIRAKKMSVAGAAEMFEIPRTTLRNWNSGVVLKVALNVFLANCLL